MSAAGQAGPPPQRIGRGFMAALVIASILNPMNTSSLATALAAISRDLDVTAAQTGLLVAVVYVVSAVAQPLMGSLTLRLGPQLVFHAGLITVLAAGIVGGLAQSLSGLLVSRVLVGIGTSSAVPAALVMLRHRADSLGLQTPARELALLAAAGNVMAAAGLPVGGLLVATFGWRSVFLINAPAAIVAIIAGLVWIPRSAGRRPSRGTQQPRLDLLGTGLFTVMVVSLAALLNNVHDPAWWLLGMVVAAGAGFVAWERQLHDSPNMAPFVDIHLLRHDGRLRAIYLRSFLLSVAVYSALYGLAQWFEIVKGMTTAVVGFAMLPQSGLSAISAVLAGRTRNFRALVFWVGPLLAAAGMTLTAASMTGWIPWAVATTILVGAAFGIGMVGNQGELYEASTPQNFGVASGLWRTASYVGGFVATALMGVIYGHGVSSANLRWFAALFLMAGLSTVVLSRGRHPVR